MTPGEIKEFKPTIEEALRMAGGISLELFGQAKTVYTKSSASDVVTEADVKINDAVISIIQERYPEHGIVSEERPTASGNEYDWLIDPLDGTLNFSRATPMFGTMIALAHNRQVIVGGTILPVFNETYLAWRGGGAWKNGQRVVCSQQASLVDSYGCGNARLARERTPYLRRILDFAETAPIWWSSFGSAAVASAYMADGRRDWYHSTGGGVWDYAASSIIMAEAGCRVTDLEDKPWTIDARYMVAANPKLHPEFLRLLNPDRP